MTPPTPLRHGATNCPTSNKRSLSTNRRKKAATLVGASQGAGTVADVGGATSGLGPRDIRKPLTVTVQYVGGACGCWIIVARRRRFIFDGHEYLHEALSKISRASLRSLGAP